MKNNANTKNMALIGVLIAIELILEYTPIGLIPVGALKLTTLHIPVIIAGVFLGYSGGAVLGVVFGLLSLIDNSFLKPGITSFVFSPFITAPGFENGNWASLIICFVPRILIGVVSCAVFRGLKKMHLSRQIGYAVAGLAGALTNTLLVMGGIVMFFGERYAAAKNIPMSGLLAAIGAIISVNGVAEAILAMVVVTAVCMALDKVYKGKKA